MLNNQAKSLVNANILQGQKHSMDLDGILLLVDRDRDKFKKWTETSKNFSLDELKASYNEWLKHYNESYAKYIDLETGDAMRDAPLIGAKLIYFHDLLNFTLHALTAYTVKLKEEYDLLKKQSKPTATGKHTKKRPKRNI